MNNVLFFKKIQICFVNKKIGFVKKIYKKNQIYFYVKEILKKKKKKNFLKEDPHS